uniref:E2F/DP family winged-helix DNA-binding domain-containing protein n=1 Tax=Meloidogyne incognita TaxID=6306 RepID=A0A914KL66_MELIC
MNEENKFVDVCGDFDEENKENCFNIRQSKIKIKEENIRTIRGDGSEETASSSHVRRGPSRKEKSLGKLCAPFLERVSLEAAQGRDVHLESVARSMNVEKRRIYDIVNVMEALEVMQKTNKSFYKWHGLDRLPELMFALQRDAQKGELPIKIAKVEKAMCSFTTNFNLNFNEEKIKLKEEKHSTEELPEDEEEDSAFGPLTSRDRCGKNSLAQLCRRFLMVLLCNPNRAVSLDVVSTMLIKDLDSEGYEPPSRSRCRRLYDIANVLAMMSLVEKKHHLFGTKKIPLFVYCGPEPDAEPTNSVLRMTEFLSRARTRIAVVSSVSSSSSTPHPSSSTHPPIPSPDVVGTSNSPKYFKEEFNEENKKNKKIIKKMKIEQEESNNNRNIASIPTLTSPSSEDIENKNSVKRRKMNRVICQQQEEEHNENDENFILPKPRPLRPQQLNVYSLPPPQQQIFLLPSSFPSSSTQQTFYCWPIQQQQPHQQQTLQTQQTHIFTTPTELFLNNSPLNYSLIPLQQQQQQQQHTQKHQQNTNKSPSKNPPINVRHSVQSILGYTIQNLNGNISCQQNQQQQTNPLSSSISSSPRAFRPLHNKNNK